jgi:hypothetical protein
MSQNVRTDHHPDCMGGVLSRMHGFHAGGMVMHFLRTIKDDIWFPIFMPWVWHWLLGIALAVGMVLGAWIWIYTLQIRGLW